jgi:hypothetical protein
MSAWMMVESRWIHAVEKDNASRGVLLTQYRACSKAIACWNVIHIGPSEFARALRNMELSLGGRIPARSVAVFGSALLARPDPS